MNEEGAAWRALGHGAMEHTAHQIGTHVRATHELGGFLEDFGNALFLQGIKNYYRESV